MEIFLPNSWNPRPYQRPLWDFLETGGKRAIAIWHRRAGKDEVLLHRTAIAAHERVANYWHCLPMYEQAKKAIWEAINPHTGKRRIDEAFPLEIRKRTDNSSMTIEFKIGSIWKVVGSDNPDSLVGAPPAGIVFSEYAISNPSAWGYLAPILDENDGWAVFITTPRGENHAFDLYRDAQGWPGWFAEKLDVTQTGYSIERVEKQRKEYHSVFGVDAGDALIEQEYYCSFSAAVLGAVWGREVIETEKAGRITKVDVEPALPIHTVWDIGKGLNMAIWVFQMHMDQVRVLDFLHGFGDGFPSHVAELNRRGYVGGTDWVPHDAKVKELGTERTRVEELKLLGRKPKLVPAHKVEDGINAARGTFAHCWFDAERCAYGLRALRNYQYEWDDDKKVFKRIPDHNWASHPSDAFRYLSMAWRDATVVEPPPKPVGRTIREMTMEEVWKMHERQTRQGVRV